MTTSERAARPRELTGRHVLIMIVAFFAVVASVNAFMMSKAVSTFAGLESANAYKAGVAFNNDLAQVRHQDALHWTVSARARRAANGMVAIEVDGPEGVPGQSLRAEVTLAHPTDARLDRHIPMTPAGTGTFRGEADAEPGQWSLIIDLSQGGERMFRSRNRIVLR